MPIKSHKLGPGTLTVGSGPLDITIQLTGAKVTPSENVESGERVKVLTGDVLEESGSVSFSYVLEGNILQDLQTGGVVDWSWENAGTEQAFTFTPNTAAGAAVAGTLYPVPLLIGGDEVDAGAMASDFSWRIKGTPTLTPGL